MNRFVLVVLLAAGLAAGCGKKTAKNPPPDSSPPPPANTSSGGGGPAVVPGGGLGVVVNPGAALGGGGSGGAVQAVRKPARRTQALNEMNTLGQVIQGMMTDTGRMPTKDQIVAELRQYPKLLEAINEGAFILTGTTEAGGLWAYEVDADTKPGIALIGGRATRSTPDDLRPYFAQMPKAPAAPPQPQPPAPGHPGTSSSTPPAGNVTVTMKDMEDIKTFIDTLSGASGRMPSPQVTYNALVMAGSPAAKLVEARAIILTGAQTRESVWAFEAKAATQGGMIVSQNGVETVTAAQLKQRVGLR